MPSDQDGDEPAAPKASYYTPRPPRPAPPPRDSRPPSSMNNTDPLKQFRDRVDLSFEPRVSTPYATHGGEKLNPFDATNFNRSKSTRNRAGNSDFSNRVPRTGSDPNLVSPNRPRAYENDSPHSDRAYGFPKVDSDSSDDAVETNGGAGPSTRQSGPNRVFAKPRRTASTASKDHQGMPTSGPGGDKTRKFSLLLEVDALKDHEPPNFCLRPTNFRLDSG